MAIVSHAVEAANISPSPARPSGWRGLAFTMTLITALLSTGCERFSQKLTFPTPYQAVLLDNGQYFFGKLEERGASYALLRDVFYVQNHVNAETKEVSSILVKRGQEWHRPDVMYINPRHIVAIETVSADSQVAEMISRAQGAK